MKIGFNEIMNFILLSCVMLLFVNLPVMAKFQVQQNPRFYGVKAGRKLVGFTCFASESGVPAVVKWYKVEKYEEDKAINNQTLKHEYANIKACSDKMEGYLFIKNVDINDSGIYYCSINEIFGPGTQLQVFSHGNSTMAERRNYMKDLIIFFQGFLLMLCLIIPLVRYYRLEKKEEAIYEEPEHDHTYEGLAIEHCGDLYEDLTAFSQTPDADASWEIESPEQE